jgi:hypothetical protein
MKLQLMWYVLETKMLQQGWIRAGRYLAQTQRAAPHLCLLVVWKKPLQASLVVVSPAHGK